MTTAQKNGNQGFFGELVEMALHEENVGLVLGNIPSIEHYLMKPPNLESGVALEYHQIDTKKEK